MAKNYIFILAFTLAKYPQLTKLFYSVGDNLKFGNYHQTDTEKNEPIIWKILDIKDGAFLVISEKALDCRKYNEISAEVTWETCSLRKWLNSDFFNDAFNESEQRMIKTVKVTADKNPMHSANLGKDTTDKVFLLSLNESDNYLNSKVCKPTDYAVKNGAYVNGFIGNCFWWLRTPGGSSSLAAYNDSQGIVQYYGNFVNTLGCCVRPAMWIEM